MSKTVSIGILSWSQCPLRAVLHFFFNISYSMQQPPIPRKPVPAASASSFVVCHRSSSYQTRVDILRTGLAAYVDGEAMRHILVELVVTRKYREAVVQYLKLGMLRDEVIDDWTCLLGLCTPLGLVRGCIQQMETISISAFYH
jgi:hypothetical protein